MKTLLIPGVSQNAFPELTQVSDSVISVVIASTPVEQTITVPAGSIFVKLTADADFYTTFDGSTVTVPGDTSSSVSTVSLLNPGSRFIRNVATIKINAKGLVHITAEFFG